MPISIQEDMLPGPSILEKFEQARTLGVPGIEFWGRDLSYKMNDIAEAMEKTGIKVSTINHGRQGRFLDPHPLERDNALTQLRESIMCAADLGAKGVIFAPHFFGPLLPDLSPWMTAVELESELLYTHLRTLEDYCGAMGVDLYVEPLNRYETHFLNRLEQAAALTRRLKHPRVKIVADLFHMALEEANLPQAIRDQAADIGHVHLADSNRRLPGQGMTNFAAIGAALKEINFSGWASFECGDPSENQPKAAQYLADFPASLDMLKKAGIV